MKLSELKNWVNSLPEQFLDYEVVNGEVGMIDEQYHYRVDKPITTLTVDEEHKEIVFLHDEVKPELTEEEKEDRMDEKLGDIFNSPEFKKAFADQVTADTWGKGRPKIYMDDDGWLVEHWADGTINKLKQLREKI